MLWLLVAALPAARADGTLPPHPLVMLISIDGLKPEAVVEAARHGLKVPHLRAFMADGAYASGVRGVMPTLTYPSHMTLMTGVAPARHGIYSNTTFDPFNRNEHGWYWYAEDARVATLWSAAAAAGLKTANVYWPTSVGAPVTYNLPQIWRTGLADDLKLQRALATPGLERELTAALGPYPGGMDETAGDDEQRARFARLLLERKHPDFITVYLTGLDTEQHRSGPFSAPSNAVLERLDAVVGSLRAAAEVAAPGRATVCVVSDHGFAPVEHDVNLNAALLEAGLFRMDEAHRIVAWEAMAWPAGGSAAVMLAHPDDAALRGKVAAVLQRLSKDPGNGIERVLTQEQLAAFSGFPEAAFLVAFKSGYEVGLQYTGPLVSAPTHHGMHGYPPDRADMLSTFLVVGPRIKPGQSLGEIDMRAIAPTLARMLNITLPEAEVAPLTLQ